MCELGGCLDGSVPCGTEASFDVFVANLRRALGEETFGEDDPVKPVVEKAGAAQAAVNRAIAIFIAVQALFKAVPQSKTRASMCKQAQQTVLDTLEAPLPTKLSMLLQSAIAQSDGQ